MPLNKYLKYTVFMLLYCRSSVKFYITNVNVGAINYRKRVINLFFY